MKTLAVTVGDVNGIGPEVALKAVLSRAWPRDVRFVFLGDPVLLEAQAAALGLAPPPRWESGNPWPRACQAVALANPCPVKHAPGQVRADAAQAAVGWIREAVAGCLDGRYAALVTAPICKEGLLKAGLELPGHTELLAQLTHTRRYAMMLMGKGLRVLLVTRHLPLREVPGHITRPAIIEAGILAAQAMEWLGIKNRSIGVCALNPHAGDGGALGDEELRLIAPAVRALQRQGIPAEGPIPADVVFYRALRGDFAAVVAMYHDQALGPLKMLAFDEGVNLTLGLPIIRTSPDHGTAFDIAGQGIADSSSMEEAIRTALVLSRRPNPWRNARHGSK